MATEHASPLQPIDIRPWGPSFAGHKTTSLFKSSQLEVLRLALPSGKVIAEHKAPGEITVQCLKGHIEFSAEGKTVELSAGQLIYLSAGVPHSLRAHADSSILVTLVLAERTR